MLKVQVDDNLGDALLTLRSAESDTQNAMRDEATHAIAAIWVPALTAAATGAQQQKLLVSGAGADVGDLSFDLRAAAGPDLSGGLDASHWFAVDYGMTPKQIVAPNRRKTIRTGPSRGQRVATTVWVGRNLPSRLADGRVIWPTIGEQSPQFVSAWLAGMLGLFEGSPFDVDEREIVGQVAGSWR